MSDGGIVTTQVDGFVVTSNSAKDESTLRANLKPKVEAALSNAGKELGKKGGEAAAKARAAESEEKPAEKVAEPEARPEPTEKTAKAPEPKPAPEPEKEPEPKAEATDESEPEKKPEEKPPNPRHDPRARMLEATRKEAEAKRALAAERQARADLEARLAALERSRQAPQEAEPRHAQDQAPEPQQFETYEAYLDARDEHNKRRWLAELRQMEASERETEAAERETEAISRTYEAARDKFREAVSNHQANLSETVLSVQTEFQLQPGQKPTGLNWLANEWFFSPEKAPSLMLYFSAHPEELDRFDALTSPRAVSREVWKLETRLEAATTGNGSEREPDVSRAAPPVKPVTGKPYVSESTEYRPGMSLDEYYRMRSKQTKR